MFTFDFRRQIGFKNTFWKWLLLNSICVIQLGQCLKPFLFFQNQPRKNYLVVSNSDRNAIFCVDKATVGHSLCATWKVLTYYNLFQYFKDYISVNGKEAFHCLTWYILSFVWPKLYTKWQPQYYQFGVWSVFMFPVFSHKVGDLAKTSWIEHQPWSDTRENERMLGCKRSLQTWCEV